MFLACAMSVEGIIVVPRSAQVVIVCNSGEFSCLNADSFCDNDESYDHLHTAYTVKTEMLVAIKLVLVNVVCSFLASQGSVHVYILSGVSAVLERKRWLTISSNNSVYQGLKSNKQQ